MSKRNGDRSRSHKQRRSKAALRLKRRELLAGGNGATTATKSAGGTAKKTKDA